MNLQRHLSTLVITLVLLQSLITKERNYCVVWSFTFFDCRHYHLQPLREKATIRMLIKTSNGATTSDDDMQRKCFEVEGEGIKTEKKILITFDLDDTLFPCLPVIQDADNAMIDALHNAGYDHASLASIRSRVKSLRRSKRHKHETYSDLQELAIFHEMECYFSEEGDNDDLSRKTKAKEIYDLWLRERHASAERHLYFDVLDSFRQMSTSWKDRRQQIYVGAITNACGNPLKMNRTLAPYFDFSISGEDPDIFPYRKPHKIIYERALDRFKKWKDQNQFMIDDDSDQKQQENEVFEESDKGFAKVSLKKKRNKRQRKKQEKYMNMRKVKNQGKNFESSSNFIWCHVGDCLRNDVGGSGKLGSIPIWVDSDELNKRNTDTSIAAPPIITSSTLKLIRASRKKGDQRYIKMTHWSQFIPIIQQIISTTEQ